MSKYNLRKRNADTDEFDMADVYSIPRIAVKKKRIPEPEPSPSIHSSEDDEEEYDPDEESETVEPNLLEAIMNKADPSKEENKEEKIKRWMEKIPIHKKRVVLPVAKSIYDRVHAIPTASDILLSNMPFGEKCALVEKIEILDILDVGTEDYFNMKKVTGIGGVFLRLQIQKQLKSGTPGI